MSQRGYVGDVKNNITNVRHSKAPRFTVVEVGEKIECEIYKPDNENDKGYILGTSIRKLGMTGSNEQCLAHVSNVICMIIPELKPYLDSALSEAGIKCVEVKLASRLYWTKSNVVHFDWPVVMVLLGCIFLTMFTDCENQNYESYLRSKILDMRGPARVHESTVIEVPFGNEKAKAIRSMLGQHSELKEAVLQAVQELSERTDRFGSLCKYLLGILLQREI